MVTLDVALALAELIWTSSNGEKLRYLLLVHRWDSEPGEFRMNEETAFRWEGMTIGEAEMLAKSIFKCDGSMPLAE